MLEVTCFSCSTNFILERKNEKGILHGGWGWGCTSLRGDLIIQTLCDVNSSCFADRWASRIGSESSPGVRFIAHPSWLRQPESVKTLPSSESQPICFGFITVLPAQPRQRRRLMSRNIGHICVTFQHNGAGVPATLCAAALTGWPQAVK